MTGAGAIIMLKGLESISSAADAASMRALFACEEKEV
jgi:hypothetical protein